MIAITDLKTIVRDGKQSQDVVNLAATLNSNEERAELLVAVLEYEARIIAASAILAKAEEALTAGDLDSVRALLQPAVDEAKQTERERQIAELEKQDAEIQAKLAELRSEVTDPVPVVVVQP